MPATYPRWDAGGAFTTLTMSAAENGSSWNESDTRGEFRADIGRYWTTHVKTEVAVGTSTRWTYFASEAYPLPGVPTPAYAYIDVERQLVSVGPAVTWQFRENTFMHPFVSGGVKLGMRREHREARSSTIRVGSLNYPVPPIDERTTTVTARPFVAAGFKSYVSRSVYVRTEVRGAFASDGLRQLALGLGMGMDF